MHSTNRRWQNHLRSKGPISFFLDRLQSHVFSTSWQHEHGAFHFPITNRDLEDELARAYFQMTRDFPYEFHIEVTTHCNLNCVMCARRALTRPKGNMTLSLFKRIIDEIAANQPHAYIHLYGIGEPLMDPGFFDKIEVIRRSPLTNVVMFTNGQLLTKNGNAKKLANSGLASVGVDLDGMSSETYDKVRVGGSFAKARDGLLLLRDELAKAGAHTRLEVAFQVYPGINDRDIEAFAQWCEAEGLEYKLVNMHTWAGLRDDVKQSGVEGLEDVHFAERKNPCPMLWNGFFIAWDGKATHCFQDADIKQPLGDVASQSIAELWRGPHRELRREQVHGTFRGICRGCSTCTNISGPAFGSKLYGEPTPGENADTLRAAS
jgi:MoaA/NifB/PqqE/SkfB family radical SAM enzyme